MGEDNESVKPAEQAVDTDANTGMLTPEKAKELEVVEAELSNRAPIAGGAVDLDDETARKWDELRASQAQYGDREARAQLEQQYDRTTTFRRAMRNILKTMKGEETQQPVPPMEPVVPEKPAEPIVVSNIPAKPASEAKSDEATYFTPEQLASLIKK